MGMGQYFITILTAALPQMHLHKSHHSSLYLDCADGMLCGLLFRASTRDRVDVSTNSCKLGLSDCWQLWQSESVFCTGRSFWVVDRYLDYPGSHNTCSALFVNEHCYETEVCLHLCFRIAVSTVLRSKHKLNMKRGLYWCFELHSLYRVTIFTALRLQALRQANTYDFTYDRGYLALFSNLGALTGICGYCLPALLALKKHLTEAKQKRNERRITSHMIVKSGVWTTPSTDYYINGTSITCMYLALHSEEWLHWLHQRAKESEGQGHQQQCTTTGDVRCLHTYMSVIVCKKWKGQLMVETLGKRD